MTAAGVCQQRPSESDWRLSLCIAGIVLAGAAAALVSLAELRIADQDRFFVYGVGATVASVLKVYLPGITGTMSVGFLFLLLSIAELTAGESVIISAVSVTMQYVWHSRKRLRAIQALFNVCSIAAASWLTHGLYHSYLLSSNRLEHISALCIAALVFFVLNTFPVALAISLTERKAVYDTWRACFMWSLPFYLVGAAFVGLIQQLAARVGWQTALLTVPFIYMIYRAYRFYLERLEAEKTHAQEMAALHLRTIEALALAIEAKDHTTHEHLNRVQVYATELALDLNLSGPETEALQAASLLHDIGKLAVPEHIISKPGKLTPEEFDKMKIHPVVGAEILERVGFPYPVVPIVAAHHERWDGTGYPYGLAGEQIPVGARILSAVDCLDALASDRQYRKALPLDEAMAFVAGEAGKAFDPRIVELLARRYVELEKLARSSRVEKGTLTRKADFAPAARPAAGFVEGSTPRAAPQQSAPGFLQSIAAARDEAQALFELSQALGNSLSLSDTLCVVAQRLEKLIPYDGIVIWLMQDDRLTPAYVNGRDKELFSALAIPVGQGLSGWVAETGNHILNGNPSVEAGYLNDPCRFSTMRSAVTAPLDGVSERVGVFTLYRSGKDSFTTEDLRILKAITSKVGISIDNALRFRAATADAENDHLTGLPNGRSLFLHLEEQISQCGAANEPLSLLVCDLDGFKQINDTFGHLKGNDVLRNVARALQQSCRDRDYVSRLGGDEFVVVLPGIAADAVGPIARRLESSILDVSRRMFGDVLFSMSIGSSLLASPTQNPEELLAEADRQMYKAKNFRKPHRSGKIAVLTPRADAACAPAADTAKPVRVCV